MDRKIKLAIIGCGGRGSSMYECLCLRDFVQLVGVCDPIQKQLDEMCRKSKENGKAAPRRYADYRKCIDDCKPDAIYIAAPWPLHFEIAIYAMEKGIAVSCEVGGGYTLDQLWEVVDQERTGSPFMMMENCCYGRLELLALNMKRQGRLGQVVACEGAYGHYLARQFLKGLEPFRLQEYLHRGSEDYPTHDIGPIAKLLDINCGNRFVSLVSVGSKGIGLQAAAQALHKTSLLKGKQQMQPDLVTTVIKCQNGETVTLFLDTTLPRYYSRRFTVHGTNGLVCEDSQSVYLETDPICRKHEWGWTPQLGNVERYYKRFDHPVWKEFNQRPANQQEGHGGIDQIECDQFLEALRRGQPMPIDVYDFATWRSIGILSEESLHTGLPVPFPDFTSGKWLLRENHFLN